MKKPIISRKIERSKEEIKSKNRELRSVNSTILHIYKFRTYRKINQQKKLCIWKSHLKIGTRNAVSVGKSTRKKKTKEDGWIEYVSCRNWLQGFCSPYKTNVSTAVESCCERKTARFRRGSGIFHSFQPKPLSSFVLSTVY